MPVARRGKVELDAFLFGPFDPPPEMGGLEDVALRRAIGGLRVHGAQPEAMGGRDEPEGLMKVLAEPGNSDRGPRRRRRVPAGTGGIMGIRPRAARAFSVSIPSAAYRSRLEA